MTKEKIISKGRGGASHDEKRKWRKERERETKKGKGKGSEWLGERIRREWQGWKTCLTIQR